MTRSFFAITVLTLAILGFIVAGWCGLHQDEALFLKAIYSPSNCQFSIKHGKIALMIMPYVGALKAAIYTVYLKVAPVTPLSLRLPMIVLLCGFTLLMIRLWCRLARLEIVAIVIAFASFHPIFVLTIVLDWGPVAFQLLLTSLGLHAWRRGWYGLVGLCAGLMIWDKAVAVWVLTGVTVSAAIFYRQELRKVLGWRFFTGLVIGALPYLYYYWKMRQIVIATQAHLSSGGLYDKVMALRGTLDGSAMLSYLFRTDARPGQVGLLIFLLLVMLAAITHPRRITGFFALAMAIPLTLMLFTTGAGGSAHHHMLVWPLLSCFICTALQPLRWPRWIFITTAACVLLLQIAAWHPYFVAAKSNGPRREWTDASTKVVAYLQQPGVCKGGVYALDWGFSDNLNALGAGKYFVDSAADQWWLNPLPVSEQARAVQRAEKRDACLIEWADGDPFFPGSKDAVKSHLEHRKQMIFNDGHGNPSIRLWIDQ